MKIEWRDVIDWEGWYQVSNFGSVRGLKSGSGRQPMKILKSKKNTDGYHYVALYRDCVCKNKPIHQLVLEAFGSPKPSPDHQVNHKNGIKDDNRPDNLEWLTRSENMKHAFKIGLCRNITVPDNTGENHPLAKLNDAKVRLIRKKHNEGESYDNLSEEFLVSISTIRDIIAQRTWRSVK